LKAGEYSELFVFALLFSTNPKINTATSATVSRYLLSKLSFVVFLFSYNRSFIYPTFYLYHNLASTARRQLPIAGFADTIRKDRLAKAQKALAKIKKNLLQLDRTRIRFDDSLLLYISDRSGTTTRSESPNAPSKEQRRIQLGREHDASKPYYQFRAQKI
jgi:hypothetical protein